MDQQPETSEAREGVQSHKAPTPPPQQMVAEGAPPPPPPKRDEGKENEKDKQKKLRKSISHEPKKSQEYLAKARKTSDGSPSEAGTRPTKRPAEGPRLQPLMEVDTSAVAASLSAQPSPAPGSQIVATQAVQFAYPGPMQQVTLAASAPELILQPQQLPQYSIPVLVPTSSHGTGIVYSDPRLLTAQLAAAAMQQAQLEQAKLLEPEAPRVQLEAPNPRTPAQQQAMTTGAAQAAPAVPAQHIAEMFQTTDITDPEAAQRRWNANYRRIELTSQERNGVGLLTNALAPDREYREVKGKLAQYLKRILGEWPMNIVGSTITEMYPKQSDLDIAIKCDERDEVAKVIDNVWSELRRHGFWPRAPVGAMKGSRVIEVAWPNWRQSMHKLDEDPKPRHQKKKAEPRTAGQMLDSEESATMTNSSTAIYVDISVGPSNNSRDLTYLIASYTRKHPMLIQAAILIKAWARRFGLINAKNGFLNSISLVIMLIYSALMETDILDPAFRAMDWQDQVFNLVIGFFKIFHDFNFAHHVVRIHPVPGPNQRTERPQRQLLSGAVHNRERPIDVEDPTTGFSTSNAVSSEVNFMLIKAALCLAWRKIGEGKPLHAVLGLTDRGRNVMTQEDELLDKEETMLTLPGMRRDMEGDDPYGDNEDYGSWKW